VKNYEPSPEVDIFQMQGATMIPYEGSETAPEKEAAVQKEVQK
jgi:hypothetical protein